MNMGGIFHVNQKKIYKKKELNGKHDIPILVVEREREKIEHKNINKVSKREIFVETKEEILLKKKEKKKLAVIKTNTNLLLLCFELRK